MAGKVTVGARRAALVSWSALFCMSVGGCFGGALAPSGMWSTEGSRAPGAFVTVPAGTWMGIRTSTALSSEACRVGDRWNGILIGQVSVGHRNILQAGDRVAGVVTCARGFSGGVHALLDLRIVSVRTQRVAVAIDAGMDAMTAARGYPVLLKPGTVLFFTMNQPVAMSVGH